jgi:transcriptional regulator with XRE-family HTH domain
MSKTVITLEIANFIKANYLKISMTTIANKVGISRCAVTNYMQKNNLKVPKEILIKFRSIAFQKPFSSKENKFIIDNIKNLSMIEIGKHLKRSYTTIQKQAHLLGLTAIIEKKNRLHVFIKVMFLLIKEKNNQTI